MDGESTTVGTGGAIVMRSDAGADLVETLLNARALTQAIDKRANPDGAHEGASPVEVGGPDDGS